MNHFESAPKTVEQLEAENRELRSENRGLRDENEELKRLASTDPLSKLKNRRGLLEAANYILPEAPDKDHADGRGNGQRGKHFAILHLDIDGFKQINDQYGHAEGDHVIEEIGKFLPRSVRKSDVVARTGGDEFVVILNGASEHIINKFFDPDAEHPRPRLGFEMEVGGQQRRISFSGGIALNKEGETINDLDHMIKRADDAQLESKDAGRDRITLFSEKEGDNGSGKQSSADLLTHEA